MDAKGWKHSPTDKQAVAGILGLFAVVIAILILSVWSSVSKAQAEADRIANQKQIYLVSARAYSSIVDNEVSIMLWYSIDGTPCGPLEFKTTEERDAYLAWLETRGKVINRGAIK